MLSDNRLIFKVFNLKFCFYFQNGSIATRVK